MDDFDADLSRVLRYNAEAERKSFEDAIDANPLEATNHLVYADWLQEQGEEEEAAFRRAMGEWVGQHEWRDIPSRGLTIGLHPRNYENSVEIDHTDADRSGLPYAVYGHYSKASRGHAALPTGVGVPDYYHSEPTGTQDGIIHDMTGSLGAAGGRHVADPLARDLSSHVAQWTPRAGGGRMRWRSYRDMESAFRKAFAAGRKS